MESRHREIADQVRMVLGVVGVYLIIFGFVASFWSIRAAYGQRQYAELLLTPHDPEVELGMARRAFRGYSRNYALCIRAADTAFKAAESAPDPENAARLFEQADYWVSRGLDLNPRLMELHYLKARLMARRGQPEQAIAVWGEYVDWHFWDPRNLEVLATFQEEAGRIDDALRTLEYLKPWTRHDAWRRRLQEVLSTRGPTRAESAAVRP